MSTAEVNGIVNNAQTEGFASYPLFPYHIVWLATNACNARCLHCSSNSGRRRASELNTTEARRMIDDLAAAGVLDVAISGGEPLLRGDLFRIMEHAAARGIRLGIGSNGSTVTPLVVDRLRALGLNRLQISVDGVERTHDAVRRWPGLFRRAAEAVRVSIEGGLRTHVCFTVHRMNRWEMPAIFELCAGWGVRRLNISRFVPTGRGDSALDLSPGEWKQVVEMCNRSRREYAGQIEVTTHLAQMILIEPELQYSPVFIGCQAGRGQGSIGPEGEVTPCVVLPLIIGSIRDKPFSELWSESPIIHALQDRRRLKGRCGMCALRDKCGGCRAVAYAYSGEHLASDPRCWLETG